MVNKMRTTYYNRKLVLVDPVCATILSADNYLEYNIVSYTLIFIMTI